MRLPRFTIAGLMGLVVVVAVGVAALRFASETWAGVLLLLTLGTLGASVLAFQEWTGARRAWWRGFALFGWGYVALAMGPWASEAIAPHLPTTLGLDALYARMHPEGEAQPQMMQRSMRRQQVIQQQMSLGYSTPMTSTATALEPTGPAPLTSPPPTLLFRFVAANATPEFLRRVGHCLWALLVACVGGVVGRVLHAHGERTGSVPTLGPSVDPGPRARRRRDARASTRSTR
jgi:hypothetical protein